jgi:hypothetical protein
MAYADDLRVALWETWQREAYGQSWGVLRERLRYSSDASWDPYFEAFNEERRDLLEIAPDTSWEEHCGIALDAFLQWLTDQVDWQQFEAQMAGGDASAHARGQDEVQWGHGIEQDMSAQASPGYFDAPESGTPTDHFDTSAPKAPTGYFADAATSPGDTPVPPAASGPLDVELAREALQIFASSADDPSILTQEHLEVLQAMPLEAEEDIDEPPNFGNQ